MGGKKIALLVGSLYETSEHALHGCLNDVENMNKLIQKRFGFSAENITKLTDKERQAHKDKHINNMVINAGPEDVLFFYFSGHGTWKLAGDSDDTELHAIVPCRFDPPITSDDFRDLINQLPSGTTFTFVADAGRSGNLISGEPVQTPDSSSETGTDEKVDLEVGTNEVTKSVSYPISFRSPSNIQSPIRASEAKPDGGILLSACQPKETAMDVIPPSTPAYGAFTYAIQQVFDEHSESISNIQLLEYVRKKLTTASFKQKPSLYCSELNRDINFLSQP